MSREQHFKEYNCCESSGKVFDLRNYHLFKWILLDKWTSQ